MNVNKSQSPKRLLIIEPDEGQRNGLKIALEGPDIVTRTASGPVEALRLIKQESFDYIFTEIRFPLSEGIHILTVYQTLSPQSHIVIQTVGLRTDVEARLRAIGIVHLLEKPVGIGDLRTILES